MTTERIAESSVAGRWVAVLICLMALLIPATVATAQDTVSQGEWTKKGYAVEGQWKIVKSGGGYSLELPNSFSTKKAPDLKLFLSNQTVAQLSNRNATQGAVLIAQLKSPRGAQSYRLPANADPASFKTLVLHCEKYSKLWAAAPLR